MNALSRLGLSANIQTLELAANPYGMTAYIVAKLFPNLTLASYSEKQKIADVVLGVEGKVPIRGVWLQRRKASLAFSG